MRSVQRRFFATYKQILPIFYSQHLDKVPTTGEPSKAKRILSDLRTFPGFQLGVGSLATEADLLSTHSNEYVQQILTGNIPKVTGSVQERNFNQLSQGNGNFKKNPLNQQELERGLGLTNWSRDLLQDVLLQVGCTISALNSIFSEHVQIAASLHGGFHHAFRNRGYSSNAFNDMAIAANLALMKYNIERVLILDLDGEPGDGTADIFSNSSNVLTLSVHSAKARSSFRAAGSFDIECEPSTTDSQYVHMIRRSLPRIIDQIQPGLIIFQAGVGLLANDARNLMKLSRKAIRDRNCTVFEEALKRNIPVLVVCGSGVCKEEEFAQQELIEAHSDVYRNALQTIVQHNHRMFYF